MFVHAAIDQRVDAYEGLIDEFHHRDRRDETGERMIARKKQAKPVIQNGISLMFRSCCSAVGGRKMPKSIWSLASAEN